MVEDTSRLSIVVVNSDGTQDTLACLHSIAANPPSVSYEILLVDNCSIDPISQHLPPGGQNVRLLQAPQKQGFARNYNLGLRAAKGEYLLILNNDTLVEAGALDALLSAFHKHKKGGLVGPKLVSPNGRIQSVCARRLLTPLDYAGEQLLFDRGLLPGKILESWLSWRLERQPGGEVPCISGACMLSSRAVVNEIGLLDEGFDFYFEDVEWCFRAGQKGYQVLYEPAARVVHLGNQSLSKVKVWAKKSEYRSALRYFARYYNLGTAGSRVLWLITIIGYLMRWIAFKFLGFVNGQKEYAKVYRELLLWMWAKKGNDLLPSQIESI